MGENRICICMCNRGHHAVQQEKKNCVGKIAIPKKKKKKGKKKREKGGEKGKCMWRGNRAGPAAEGGVDLPLYLRVLRHPPTPRIREGQDEMRTRIGGISFFFFFFLVFLGLSSSI